MTEPELHTPVAGPAQTFARIVADPNRYEILRMLANCNEGGSCSSLRERIPLTPPTFSHHMKELRDAGLVDERREGRTVHYTVRRDAIECYLKALRGDLLG